MSTTPRRPWLGALALDTAAVLVFAVAGRQSHDGGSGLPQLLGVAAPFLIGLVIGWLIVPGARRQPLALTTGVGVAAAMLVIGFALRRLAWDRGIALSFIIVTTLVLGALLLGWRALWTVADRRHTVRS